MAEAKLSVMTNFLHYGTGVFEGIRGNWNEERKQTYIFRLKEHYERLIKGCKVLKITLPHTVDQFCQLTVELVAKNGLKEDLYIRPLAYKCTEALGVRCHGLEDGFFMFVIPWGPYLNVEKVKCGVSSWRRPGNNVMPAQTKITGQYINSALAKTEAYENGFDEAILLTEEGYVSEGSGENIFLVIDGSLVTPPIYNSILPGITRDTVIKLAKDELGIEIIERQIDRTELYMANEAFFTGTATHIAPIGEIDHRPVGNGEIGSITAKLQKIYTDVIRGISPKYISWCTPVYK